MALLERRNGGAAVIDDRFTRVDDEASLPTGPVIVSLSRFQAERDALLARDGDCGVCLLYTSPSPRDQRGSRMPSSA